MHDHCVGSMGNLSDYAQIMNHTALENRMSGMDIDEIRAATFFSAYARAF